MSEESVQLEPSIKKVRKTKRSNLPDFQPLPWERQKGESGKAYEAFVKYRDQRPGERTVLKTSELINKSLPLIYKWKNIWQWDNRVLQYDAFMQQNAIMDYQRKAREMNNRHLMIAYGFQVKVAQALEKMPIENLIDNPAEMLRWFQVASDLERRAMNQPTEIIRQESVSVNVNVGDKENPCTTVEERENRIMRIIKTLKDIGAINEPRKDTIIEGTATIVGETTGTTTSGTGDEPKSDEVHPSKADGKADSVPSP